THPASRAARGSGRSPDPGATARQSRLADVRRCGRLRPDRSSQQLLLRRLRYCAAASADGLGGSRGVRETVRQDRGPHRQDSGDYGFADETDGEGRFDRYSVLLAGEVARHFIETDGKPPEEALGWLRKSAAVMLSRMHASGEGF